MLNWIILNRTIFLKIDLALHNLQKIDMTWNPNNQPTTYVDKDSDPFVLVWYKGKFWKYLSKNNKIQTIQDTKDEQRKIQNKKIQKMQDINDAICKIRYKRWLVQNAK